VLDKYENRGFAVLAVNLEPTQRDSVVPLLDAMHVRFVPLESDWAWAEKHYNVQGTPSNALIDKTGRIVFKPEVHDTSSRIVLERQVEALLDEPQRR
jgi:hypothetical protein